MNYESQCVCHELHIWKIGSLNFHPDFEDMFAFYFFLIFLFPSSSVI